MGKRDGEIVEFLDMMDTPCWYVRGHLTADEATQACDEYWREYESFDSVEDSEPPKFGPCMHVYGRWGFSGEYLRGDGCTMEWYTSRTGGRGWQKVTRVWLPGEYDTAEQIEAVRYAARKAAEQQFPDYVKIENPYAHPWRDRHMVSVRVHLRDAVVGFYPWNRQKTWAQPKNWRVHKVAWLERAGLVSV